MGAADACRRRLCLGNRNRRRAGAGNGIGEIAKYTASAFLTPACIVLAIGGRLHGKLPPGQFSIAGVADHSITSAAAFDSGEHCLGGSAGDRHHPGIRASTPGGKAAGSAGASIVSSGVRIGYDGGRIAVMLARTWLSPSPFGCGSTVMFTRRLLRPRSFAGASSSNSSMRMDESTSSSCSCSCAWSCS